MWAVLPRRTQLFIVAVAAVVIVFGLEAFIDLTGGTKPHPLQVASMVASELGLVLIPAAGLLWRWAWRRFPWLQRKVFPDLNGTWSGEIKSTWVNPADGQAPAPIHVTMTIKMTIFTASVTMRSDESTSHSTRSQLEANADAGLYRLWYWYDNDPRAQFSHRSGQHRGAAWLELDLDDDRDRLRGQYFTNRRTCGDIDVRRTRTAKRGAR